MKTFFMLVTLLFLNGCGTDTTTTESSITPPQPTANGAIQPPTSPELN